MPTQSFSDFMNNASPEERAKVFKKAAHLANEDQRKIMESMPTQNCKHEYIAGDGDLGQPECKYCGLLKSTIEAIETPTQNWREEFSELFISGDYKSFDVMTGDAAIYPEKIEAFFTSKLEEIRNQIQVLIVSDSDYDRGLQDAQQILTRWIGYAK